MPLGIILENMISIIPLTSFRQCVFFSAAFSVFFAIFKRKSIEFAKSMILCPSFCFIGISLLLLPPLCRPFLTDHLRHWSHDGVGTFLPICRICKCSRQNGVECVPRRDGEQFKLKRVHLPHWADSLSVSNFSFAAFPLFASAPHLRQFRLRYCAIATALPPLAFLPFYSLESVQLTDCRLRNDALPSALFQPLGQLRELSLSGNGLRDVRIELAPGQILDRFDLSQNPLCPSRKNSDKTHGREWPLTRQLRLENANVKAVNGTHWTFGETEKAKQQQNNSSKSGECHWPISDGHWRALEQFRLGGNLALQLHPSVLPRLATLRHLDLTDAASVPEELFLEWTRHPETQWHHIGMRRARIKRTVADKPIVNTDAGHRNGKHNHWTFCSTNLEWLDISELKGIEDGTLRLDGCARLKWLYADANALEAIRIGDSGPAALLSLSARDNRLRRWPAGLLRSAHSLSSVQLANNAIVRLPLGLLEQYPELNSLDLSQNAIRHFPVGDLSHPPQNSLMFLNLSQNQLRTVELPTLSSLTVLDLSDNVLAKFNSLGRLPALEHLHLSGNAGIRLTVTTEHPTLIRLHLGKCSLTKMPDLTRLVALRQLDLRGNQLESVPGIWLPSQGVNVLAIGSNALRELGWDWHTEQLDALRELRAEENPWKCACAFVPSLEKLLATQTQQKKIQNGHFCPAGDSQRKMAKKCPREGKQKKHNEEEEDALAAQFEDDSLPNALVFFLPPFALITAAFIGIILLLRYSLKRKWRHDNSSASSPFAYRLIWPNGEAI